MKKPLYEIAEHYRQPDANGVPQRAILLKIYCNPPLIAEVDPRNQDYFCAIAPDTPGADIPGAAELARIARLAHIATFEIVKKYIGSVVTSDTLKGLKGATLYCETLNTNELFYFTIAGVAGAGNWTIIQDTDGGNLPITFADDGKTALLHLTPGEAPTAAILTGVHLYDK